MLLRLAGWDGFNFEMGTDPENHTPTPGNPLLQVFSERWAANEIYYQP